MEKSSKRGKIPTQDWPSIISRYQAGETLASIARTYDCSPPAISYIVSRSRARKAAAGAPSVAAPQEPQLVKSHPGGTPLAASRSTDVTAIDSPSAPAAERHFAEPAPDVAEPRGGRADAAGQPGELRLFPDAAAPSPMLRRDPMRHGEDAAVERPRQPSRDLQLGGNGNMARSLPPAGAPQPYGEPRRTLHLSLSGGDGGHRQEPQAHAPAGGAERAVPPRSGGASPGSGPAMGRPAHQGMGQFLPVGNVAAVRSAAEAQSTKEGGAFIDHALRERVDGDIAAFLAAFDAALDHDTAESRTGLREATDRLLRAGARTRIELERLEARVPLVAREKGGQEARGFRPR
jgi:hypothetical protein